MRYLKDYQLFESKLSPVTKVIKRNHIDEINHILLDSEDEFNITKEEWIEYWHNVDLFTYDAGSISFGMKSKGNKDLTNREISEFIELVMRVKHYYDMYMEKELIYGINILGAEIIEDGYGSDITIHREDIDIKELDDLLSKRFSKLDMCIFVD